MPIASTHGRAHSSGCPGAPLPHQGSLDLVATKPRQRGRAAAATAAKGMPGPPTRSCPRRGPPARRATSGCRRASAGHVRWPPPRGRATRAREAGTRPAPRCRAAPRRARRDANAASRAFRAMPRRQRSGSRQSLRSCTSKATPSPRASPSVNQRASSRGRSSRRRTSRKVSDARVVASTECVRSRWDSHPICTSSRGHKAAVTASGAGIRRRRRQPQAAVGDAQQHVLQQGKSQDRGPGELEHSHLDPGVERRLRPVAELESLRPQGLLGLVELESIRHRDPHRHLRSEVAQRKRRCDDRFARRERRRRKWRDLTRSRCGVGRNCIES